MSFLTGFFIFSVIAGAIISMTLISSLFNDLGDDPVRYLLAFLMTLVYAIFTFGLIGGAGTHYYTETIQENFMYQKIDNKVVTSFENSYTKQNKTIIFEDAKTYNTIEDTSNVIQIVASRNVYGHILHSEYSVIKQKE